jgi:hypothetical protein
VISSTASFVSDLIVVSTVMPLVVGDANKRVVVFAAELAVVQPGLGVGGGVTKHKIMREQG